jgi:hypothetical protein
MAMVGRVFLNQPDAKQLQHPQSTCVLHVVVLKPLRFCAVSIVGGWLVLLPANLGQCGRCGPIDGARSTGHNEAFEVRAVPIRSCLMSGWTLRSAVLESPIRLAGRKGRSGGTRSEAEMGPTSMKEPPIRLAGRKGRSGGTRSEAEMGPASIEESRSRQGGKDGGNVFVERAGLCCVVQLGRWLG